MATYGCTSPFELDLDHICTDKTFVHNITQDWYADGYFRQHYTRKTSCQHPCTYLEPKVDAQYSHLYINDGNDKFHGSWLLGGTKFVTAAILPERVTVLKSQNIYSELSLVAEIGGYVGLFLGVSVLQVSGLMKAMLATLWRLTDKWNRQRLEHT